MTDTETPQDNPTPLDPAVAGLTSEIEKLFPGSASKFEDQSKLAEGYNNLEPRLTQVQQENATLRQQVEALKGASPQTPEAAPGATAEPATSPGSLLNLDSPVDPSVSRQDTVDALVAAAQAQFTKTQKVDDDLRGKISEATGLGPGFIDTILEATEMKQRELETTVSKALGGPDELKKVMDHIRKTREGQARDDIQTTLTSSSTDVVTALLKGIQAEIPQTQNQIQGTGSSSGGQRKALDVNNPDDMLEAFTGLGHGDFWNPENLKMMEQLGEARKAMK